MRLLRVNTTVRINSLKEAKKLSKHLNYDECEIVQLFAQCGEGIYYISYEDSFDRLGDITYRIVKKINVDCLCVNNFIKKKKELEKKELKERMPLILLEKKFVHKEQLTKDEENIINNHMNNIKDTEYDQYEHYNNLIDFLEQ